MESPAIPGRFTWVGTGDLGARSVRDLGLSALAEELERDPAEVSGKGTDWHSELVGEAIR
jgi:hypothetical protein